MSSAACIDCTAGTYQDSAGSTACIDCAAGTYQDSAGSADPTCIDCAAGTYQDTAGSAACIACPVSAVTTGPGAQDVSECLCSPGFEGVIQNQNSMCSACRVGEEKPDVGETPCGACDATSADLDSDPSTPCTACPSGTFSTPRTSCTNQCGPGYYCPNEQAGCADQETNPCSRCDPGHVSPDGLACIQCSDPGKRANEEQTACESCSMGQEPSADRSACISCSDLPFVERGATYSPFGVQCQECAGQEMMVDANRTTCTACGRGEQPTANKTGCEACPTLMYSNAGICMECPSPNIVNADKDQCDDVSTNTVRDLLVVQRLMNTTDLVPRAVLTASVTDVDSVVQTNSPDSLAFVRGMKEHLAEALGGGISPDMILISVLQNADEHGGRRTLQQGAAGTVTFNVQILNTDDEGRLSAISTLQQQLDNASSTLRTSSGAAIITTRQNLVFDFVCDVGTFRASGATSCDPCPDNEVPNRLDGTANACDPCGDGETHDQTHSLCVCADGYYQSFAGTRLLKCFGKDAYESFEPETESTNCRPCFSLETGCVDHGEDKTAIRCAGSTVMLQPGFSVSMTAATQSVPLDRQEGHRAIFECNVEDACLGDPARDVVEGPTCSAAYAGPLCDYCSQGYSRPGFSGECTECSAGLSLAWVVLGTIIAVAVATSGLYFVASVHAGMSTMAVVITLGKIGVSLAQVLTQLDFSLDINWPDSL